MGDTLNALSNVLDKFGWWGLIVVACIGLLYVFINKAMTAKEKKTVSTIDECFKNLSTAMITQNNALIQTIKDSNALQEARMNKAGDNIYSIIIKAMDNKDVDKRAAHTENINKRLSVSSDINYKIKTILDKYNASRVSVVEFHNSKENENGLAFAWYDIQYEFTARGVKPDKRKDVQISSIMPVIEDLSTGKVVIEYDRADIDNIYNRSSDLNYYLGVERNDVYVIFAGLYNDFNALVGFLAIEYMNENDIPDEIEESDIESYATIISNLIKYDKSEN